MDWDWFAIEANAGRLFKCKWDKGDSTTKVDKNFVLRLFILCCKLLCDCFKFDLNIFSKGVYSGNYLDL